MEEYEYMLQMKHVSKSFPGVKALDDMMLDVRPGSVHVVMGENGAGKSTLMKILMGLYQADSGEIIFKGKPITVHSPVNSAKLGIAMIHQELNTVPEMTVAQYMFLGRELLSHGVLDQKAMNRMTREYLDRMEIGFSEKLKMGQLTQSETQLLEIAKAVSCNASLIIMDEPTSAISDKEVAVLFRTIHQLTEKGASIIYITHKIDEVTQIGDDITILRDGQWIASKKVSETDRNEIITMMIGRELKEQYPKATVPIGKVVLDVEKLCSDGQFQDISFHANQGEIVGFSGLIGAGRTEVMQAVFGLDRKDSGTIRVEDKVVSIHAPKEAIENGIVLVPEDRKNLGLILMHSIRDNIALPNYANHSKYGFINTRMMDRIAIEMIEELGVKTPSPQTSAGQLSGGNQQKVVLAKWLHQNVKVLILDEPTRGIDVGAKAEIFKLMVDMAKQGICIVMISSELPEILNMSDRIYVMKNGRITGEFTRQEATQERIMRCAL